MSGSGQSPSSLTGHVDFVYPCSCNERLRGGLPIRCCAPLPSIQGARMSTKTVSLPWTTVITDSNSEEFIPATGWMSTNGIRQIRCSWELRAPGAAIAVRPGFQFADTYDDPDSFFPYGTESATGSAGYYFPKEYEDPTKTTPDNTTNKQLIRFGWLDEDTDGEAFARVSGVVEILPE